MSKVYYTLFEHRFLKAGFLADVKSLLLIDISYEREEFIEAARKNYGSVSEDRGPFTALAEQLTEYLDGVRRGFSIEVSFVGTPFARAVLESMARIPYGEVWSYADVAKAAGNPRAVRAAGSAVGRNPYPILIPCHRVVRSGGEIGQFGGGVELKRRLLALEGVQIVNDRITAARCKERRAGQGVPLTSPQ